jgi:23S rRNA U2552 (ribose-2'-O)-methylase RlmE/FtsJ
MKSLFEIFKKDITKPSTKWLHYFDVYEKHVSKYRNKNIKILEIGVEYGGSLQMWKKYFGPNCSIIGIDINKDFKYEEDQIIVEIGNQADTEFLEKVVKQYGPFDIIIDDGGHYQDAILTSFFFLYPFLNLNGCYIIEDLHTSYFEAYQGGLNSKINVISKLSEFVHDVNSEFINIRESYNKTLDNISSICFYNSMIVIEKETLKDKYNIFSSQNKLFFELGKNFLRDLLK